jgi:D-alanyl-D-alanine carboxypeptidase
MRSERLPLLKIFTAISATVCIGVSQAQPPQNDFDTQVQKILLRHYNQYKTAEYFSGAELSIYIPNQNIKNYYVGRVAQDSKSKLISADTLFQIGSITKSFTAAMLLQLEKEGKLKLTDTLKTWLPQYNKWPGITITQLLNMTSGLPNYSETPLFNSQLYYNLGRVWTTRELIDFAYPPVGFSPPLKSGYFYSNTNYLLAGLILEKATKNSFEQELTARTISKANLTHTFYVLNTLKPSLQSRLAHGYYYGLYDNPSMVGKDISEGNLSWAAAAGGIIANSEDIIKWVQNLFTGHKILDDSQKIKLMSLISQNTGKPLPQTTSTDPRGFGLGVAQINASNEDNLVGQVWFYEGETLGFRSLYWYKPCNGVILSTIFNSATNSENDHAGQLLEQIYHSILTQYPQLNCQ